MSALLAYKNTAVSVAVKATAGLLYGAVVTAGADAASLTISDNSETGAPVVMSLKAAAGATVACMLPAPISCARGIYATVTGTTPSVTVLYV